MVAVRVVLEAFYRGHSYHPAAVMTERCDYDGSMIDFLCVPLSIWASPRNGLAAGEVRRVNDTGLARNQEGEGRGIQE